MLNAVNLLKGMEAQPVLETLVKEVAGINAPKTAFVRSKDEFIDVGTNEFINTASFFGVGYLLDRLSLRFKAFRPGGPLWGVVGKSLALQTLLFSMMWATPFLRNYLTAKRTGTADYTKVIGANDYKSSFTSRKEDAQRLDTHLEAYRNQFFKIIGLGLMGAALSLGGAYLGLKHVKSFSQLPKLLGKVLEKLSLEGGSFNNFNGIWHAGLFWGLPAYGGWIHASRDNYERKEQLLKAINFFVFFFGAPMVFDRLYGRKIQALLKAPMAKITLSGLEQALGKGTEAFTKAKSLWLKKEGYGLLASIILLGVSPTILNIFLTKNRLKRDQALQAQNGQAAAPVAFSAPALPRGNFQRKSFEEFVSAGRRFSL